MNKYNDSSEHPEHLRPLECPVCGRKHPLQRHGKYLRNVCDLQIKPVKISIFRYRCSGCRHTVSFLPSFCVPRKQYSAAFISFCFQLLFSCGVSLRQVGRSSAANRILVGVWLKQWNFSSPGIISTLRNCFGFEPQCINVCSDHYSSYITPDGLEAFHVSCDAVLGDKLTSCDGRCDKENTGGCGDYSCRGIIKLLQEKFASLAFEVRLF